MSLPRLLAQPASEHALLPALARLYAGVPDGMLIATMVGGTLPAPTIRQVNAAFTTLCGFDGSELVGRPLAFLASEGHDGAFERLIAASSAGRPVRAELAIRRKGEAP